VPFDRHGATGGLGVVVAWEQRVEFGERLFGRCPSVGESVEEPARRVSLAKRDHEVVEGPVDLDSVTA
jgi:hypothetical protein